MSKVVVKAHPETGKIVTVSKNPEWGVLRVEKAGAVSISNGIVNISKSVAFPRMLMKTVEALGLDKLKDGDEFPIFCDIQVRESFEPFWVGQSPKVNPSTGEEVTKDNKPVYRTSEIVEVGSPTYLFVESNYSKAVNTFEAIENGAAEVIA